MKSRVGNKADKRTKRRHKEPEGAYYWSERDAQYELLNELRRRFDEMGKEDWVHAEGYIEKTGSAKGEKSKRADIAVINFDSYLKWHERWANKAKKKKRFPKYEALIEVKMVWRGLLPQKDQGKIVWSWRGATSKQKKTVDGIEEDLRKLSDSLSNEKTKEAHLILLDSTQEDSEKENAPYFSSCKIKTLSSHYRSVYLWHWPDSNGSISCIPKSPVRCYYRGKLLSFCRLPS